MDLWNGNHFIGVLLTGTMVQYEATPGEHLFMARSAENWSYASGVVAEGKRYYLKANFFPRFLAQYVVLGIAERTDQRIEEWDKLKARAPVEEERAKFESTKQPNLQKRIQGLQERRGAIFRAHHRRTGVLNDPVHKGLFGADSLLRMQHLQGDLAQAVDQDPQHGLSPTPRARGCPRNSAPAD